jgi:diguanylate cyclase (GGDEF)-like protein
MPILTDLVERGALPTQPRGWITEIIAGAIVLALVHRVRRHYREVASLARTDPLTGLLNRRVFEEAIQDECARAQRLGEALSLVYLDVDGFKGINDRFGHKEGDRVLQLLAHALREVIRARVDRGFRLGGDEFALLLPGTDVTHAARVVARVRRTCEWSDRPPAAGSWGISAGVVALRPQEAHAELLQRADCEMYRQKQARACARGEVTDRAEASRLIVRLAELRDDGRHGTSLPASEDQESRGPRRVA